MYTSANMLCKDYFISYCEIPENNNNNETISNITGRPTSFLITIMTNIGARVVRRQRYKRYLLCFRNILPPYSTIKQPNSLLPILKTFQFETLKKFQRIMLYCLAVKCKVLYIHIIIINGDDNLFISSMNVSVFILGEKL